MYNADIRALLEQNNIGVIFTYKGHRYKIITGLIVEDLMSHKWLIQGIHF